MIGEWRHLVPEPVARICAWMRQHGYEAWVVGGAMRDTLRGAPPNDWDIASSAPADVVMGLFPKAIPTGIAHGTVTVVENGGEYEITTYRGEGPYTDGRRPDFVYPVSTIEEDLSRRDFTVNAIAGDPITGEVRDPWGGVPDMAAMVLRAVGDPDARFNEDGLRIMRAARFAATLAYALDPATMAAIPRAVPTFMRTSAERKFDELTKMLLKAAKPSIGLDVMYYGGIMQALLPQLAVGFGMEQGPYHRYDVLYHTFAVVDCTPPRLAVRLAALLHDVGKPQTRSWSEDKGRWIFYGHSEVGAEIADAWLKAMKTPTELREAVVLLIRHHEFQHTLGSLEHRSGAASDAAIRRWLKRIGGPCVLRDLLDLRRADLHGQGMSHVPAMLADADALQTRVTELLTAAPLVSECTLAISGLEIAAILGVKPGPLIGKVKRELVERVTDDPTLNSREKLEPLIPSVAMKVSG